MNLKRINFDNSVLYISSLTLALLPILAPYKFLGPFSMAHFVLGISYVLSVIVFKKISIVKDLMYLLAIHVGLSLTAYMLRINQSFTEEIPYSLIFITITTFLVMQVIRNASPKYFVEAFMIISLLASLFLFYQYMLMLLGINPPNGQLPFLKLNENSGWANIDINNIYMRRVHSIFPEPSYFAIYILPIFAYTLSKKKIIISVLLFLALFLSSSSLGIIGSLIILGLSLLTKNLLNSILRLLILILASLVFYLMVRDMNIFEYNMNKIGNLEENSDIRLIGYIHFFELLPDVFKVIGVGSNQFTYYFYEYGLKNYSNAFVIALLNFGIIGFLGLVLFIIKTFLKFKSRRVYILIFLIVCTIDAFLYNMYFFYILSFVFISKVEKQKLNNTNNVVKA